MGDSKIRWHERWKMFDEHTKLYPTVSEDGGESCDVLREGLRKRKRDGMEKRVGWLKGVLLTN